MVEAKVIGTHVTKSSCDDKFVWLKEKGKPQNMSLASNKIDQTYTVTQIAYGKGPDTKSDKNFLRIHKELETNRCSSKFDHLFLELRQIQKCT